MRRLAQRPGGFARASPDDCEGAAASLEAAVRRYDPVRLLSAITLANMMVKKVPDSSPAFTEHIHHIVLTQLPGGKQDVVTLDAVIVLFEQLKSLFFAVMFRGEQKLDSRGISSAVFGDTLFVRGKAYYVGASGFGVGNSIG